MCLQYIYAENSLTHSGFYSAIHRCILFKGYMPTHSCAPKLTLTCTQNKQQTWQKSTLTCLCLPFWLSVWLPGYRSGYRSFLVSLIYFGSIMQLQRLLFFLNNLPVCCAVSLERTALDSISGPRQTNLGQSCRCFLETCVCNVCVCACVCLNVVCLCVSLYCLCVCMSMCVCLSTNVCVSACVYLSTSVCATVCVCAGVWPIYP